MKTTLLIIITLSLISCVERGNSTTETLESENPESTDTLLYFWDPDFTVASFDTTIGETVIHMDTYSLNDSAVYNETWSDARNKNSNLVEYSVAHNYATDLRMGTLGNETKVTIRKEDFKDSLNVDFYTVCHMWKNKFSHLDEGRPVFHATLSQPDTDYRAAVVYTMTGEDEVRVIKVIDESYNGSEE